MSMDSEKKAEIRVKNIIRMLEEWAPRNLAEGWDNVGLLTGDADAIVRGVMVCLEVNESVVDEAVSRGANMIISHHPVIFKPVNSITTANFKGRTLIRLIQEGIACYGAHTNMDSAIAGVNDALAARLGLVECRVMCPGTGDAAATGLGRIGKLPGDGMTAEEFAEQVARSLGATDVRLIGDASRRVKNVAVWCGSFERDALQGSFGKADILVTGDVKYHDARDIVDMGFGAIDAGHYTTEKIIADVIASRLKSAFKSICITVSDVDLQPFRTIIPK